MMLPALDPIVLCSCTVLLPLLLTCTALPAQDKPKSPDAETKALLARIDAARGKAPAALTIDGKFAVAFEGHPQPVVEGTFRSLFGAGELARETCSMGPGQALERGVAEAMTWEVDPSMGAKRHAGSQAVAVRRCFAILRGRGPAGLYASIERTGTQSLDGREHVVLRATPAQGKPETWYIDSKTALPSRVDLPLPAPESADVTFDLGDWHDAQLLFSDYRAVDGFQVPHRRQLKMGPATVSYTAEKVTTAASLPAEQFAPPAEVLKLPEPKLTRQVGDDGKPLPQIAERQAQPVASIRLKCKPAEISKTLATALPEVMAQITAAGGKCTGAPFSRYHAMSETEVDIEAGIPVAKPIEAKGRVRNSELPGGRCAMIWHIGPYEKLCDAYAALQQFVAKEGLKNRGAPWEIYWTDPGMQPDPAQWRTQVFQPIE